MEKSNIIKTIKKLKEEAKERKFSQSYDLIVNLKNIDLKKTENHIDFFVDMHHSRGKKVSVCALVGPELKPEAEKVCDETIDVEGFKKYAKDKKAAKKLAIKHSFFIAQANVMGQLAGAFGKVFGPRGKMPNPKVGCVVPPKASLKPLYDRLQKVVRVSAKTSPSIKCAVGTMDMSDEDIADNLVTIYNALVHHLPSEHNNIKKRFIKLTMGKPMEFDDKGNSVEKEQPKEEEKKKPSNKSEKGLEKSETSKKE